MVGHCLYVLSPLVSSTLPDCTDEPATLAADDALLLLWDLTTASPPAPAARGVPQQPKTIDTPALAYTAASEINSVAWGGGGEWVSVGCGKTVRTLRCV